MSNALLQAGVEVARYARRREAADELLLVARERALEVSLAAVSKVRDLDAVEYNDAMVRLLSEVELEARSKSLMVASCLLAAGAAVDDAAVVELTHRALR